MIYLIPLAAILLSMGGIFYIVARKIRSLPKVGEEGLVYPEFESSAPARTSSDQTNLRKLPALGGSGSVSIFMEKFFRKMRVRIMKIENWLEYIAKGLKERRMKNAHKSEDSEVEEKNQPTFISARGDLDGSFDEQYWLGIIKEEPQSLYPYKKLSDIYIAREDFREARWALKCALKLDPADGEAKAKMDGLRGKRTKKV